MSIPRSDFALVLDKTVIGNNIRLFAVGGCNTESYILDSIEKFDAQTQKWAIVKNFGSQLNMPGLKAHQAISLPDGIIVMGGYDGSEYLSRVWKFKPDTLEIVELPCLNVARASFRAELSENCQYIYAIGGINDKQGPLSSVERFDVVTQAWSIISPMNHARYNHASHCCLTKM